jgi:hypothetical protein
MEFKVLLEDELHSLAERYFYYHDLVNGNYSLTKWGKNKDKEKYENELKKSLISFIKKSEEVYPQFKGKYDFVTRRQIRNTTIYFIDINWNE